MADRLENQFLTEREKVGRRRGCASRDDLGQAIGNPDQVRMVFAQSFEIIRFGRFFEAMRIFRPFAD